MPKGLSPFLRRGFVREPQAVFVIPGDRDQPHALFVHFVHALEPALKRHAVLHGEHGGHLPRRTVLFNVREAVHRRNQVRVLCKLRFIARSRLFKILPGADFLFCGRIVRRGRDIERKALQQAPALPHPEQIQVAIIAAEVFRAAAAVNFAGEGIAVQINKAHVAHLGMSFLMCCLID